MLSGHHQRTQCSSSCCCCCCLFHLQPKKLSLGVSAWHQQHMEEHEAEYFEQEYGYYCHGSLIFIIFGYFYSHMPSSVMSSAPNSTYPSSRVFSILCIVRTSCSWKERDILNCHKDRNGCHWMRDRALQVPLHDVIHLCYGSARSPREHQALTSTATRHIRAHC